MYWVNNKYECQNIIEVIISFLTKQLFTYNFS